MGTKWRIFLAVLLTVALSGTIPAGSIAANSRGEIAGVPYAGGLGIAESIGQVMMRQAAREVAGPVEKDQEGEIQQPDRTGLPQNPASPRSSSFPERPPGVEAQSSGVEPFTPQAVGTSFTGATLSGVNPTFAFPPDCMGAVGPTQYVVFVNGRLVTFSKTTGLADGVLNADPDVFFAPVINGSSTSDPRIRYDRLTGRWFLVIINVSTPNRILLAVSDAASGGVITGSTVFTFFFIDIAATPPAISSTCLADYPTLGLDNNALYIGTNNFCGSPSQTFNSSDGYVVRKSSILGAGPIVLTVFRGLVASPSAAGPYTPQGVDNFDPAATEGYFIGVDNATFGTLMARRVSNPGGAPTISANLSVTVTATSFPINVNHLGNTGGTSGRLSALDDRLFAAHLRGGRLWTAHNIGVNNTGVASGTLTRDGSRWYELNVPVGSGAPTVAQSGTIYTPSASNTTDQRSYWIPSILPSGQGHVAMGFSTAGTNERVNSATVGRLSGDAAGTMQTPVLFTASATAYNPPSDPGGTNGRRWGDYTYTSLDPIDDMTIWTVQQFCDATNSYGVRVAKLIAPPPATPASVPDVTAGQSLATVTLTGTSVSGSGFYDPGPNLPGVPAFSHLSVGVTNGTATGTPPAVISATWVDPTTITLSLNASAATANLPGEKYTVTVTNPDGQTAAAAVLRVIAGTPTASIAAGPGLGEGNAGTTPFGFTVNLSSAATAPVTIDYQTSDGTATAADGDYPATISSIVIPIGGVSGPISIPVNGDTRLEADETFNVTLTGATNANLGAPVTATATILNDDLPPLVSVNNVGQAEGNSGLTAYNFTVSLSEPSGLPASADFATAEGTATLADNDFTAAAGTVNFAPGVVSQPVTVQVNGDLTLEPDETFTVGLSNLVGAQAGTLSGNGTIQNDDLVPSILIADVSRTEGNSGATADAFVVSLSNPSDQAVTVDYQTADGSATLADGDYQSAAGQLVLPAHVTTDTITVPVNGDLCGEADELFSVVLSNPVGASVPGPPATGTIQNDDDATVPTVAVTFPNGGEVVQTGDLVNILWSATDNVAVTGVDLLLSRDSGASWPETLAAGIANSGTFGWTVTAPSSPTASALVRVVAHDAGCNRQADDSDAPFRIADPASGAPDAGPIADFALGLIRPNPTAGVTHIDYQLPRESRVRLSILDLQGREVAVLVDGSLGPGRYQATWSGETARGPAAKGVYFVRYQGGGRSFTRRLVLAR